MTKNKFKDDSTKNTVANISVSGKPKRELSFQLRKNMYGMYSIYYTEGGTPPAELQGVYTDEALAESAMAVYKERIG